MGEVSSLFQKECRKWIAFFGLKQYMVAFHEKKLDMGVGAKIEAYAAQTYAASRFASQEELDTEEEVIVRTLENTVYPLLRGKVK